MNTTTEEIYCTFSPSRLGIEYCMDCGKIIEINDPAFTLHGFFYCLPCTPSAINNELADGYNIMTDELQDKLDDANSETNDLEERISDLEAVIRTAIKGLNDVAEDLENERS